jgi:hypothetical protein
VLGPWYQRCDLSICESLEPQVCLTLDVQLGLLVNNETGRVEGLFSNEVGGSPNTVPLDPVATALNGGSGRGLIPCWMRSRAEAGLETKAYIRGAPWNI